MDSRYRLQLVRNSACAAVDSFEGPVHSRARALTFAIAIGRTHAEHAIEDEKLELF